MNDKTTWIGAGLCFALGMAGMWGIERAGAASVTPDPAASGVASAGALGPGGKVKVEMFVMSQCPYGVQAENAFKPTGGLAILKGNLAPEGCVVKVAGHERPYHRGPARIFEREEDAMTAVTKKLIKSGDVVVIRYEGPKGGPGMREMLGVTAAIVGEGLGEVVALINQLFVRTAPGTGAIDRSTSSIMQASLPPTNRRRLH